MLCCNVLSRLAAACCHSWLCLAVMLDCLCCHAQLCLGGDLRLISQQRQCLGQPAASNKRILQVGCFVVFFVPSPLTAAMYQTTLVVAPAWVAFCSGHLSPGAASKLNLPAVLCFGQTYSHANKMNAAPRSSNPVPLCCLPFHS